MFSLMPCPFTGPKNFGLDQILCARSYFFTYCGSHKHFVPEKIGFCAGTKVFEEARNEIFGLAQKIWAQNIL